MSTNKYIIYTVLMLYGSLSATNLGDFAGYWEGTESLSSPTMSFEEREVYMSLRHNASLDNNLLYNSNSDFIYNGYLDWAAHYFTYNKSENQVTFGRRFTTPLGILGTQELVYNILEDDGSRISLEFVSDDLLSPLLCFFGSSTTFYKSFLTSFSLDFLSSDFFFTMLKLSL